MQLIQNALLSVVALLLWSGSSNATATAAPGTLSCKRVALAAQSGIKWTVRCVTNEATAAATSASFDPTLVRSFYVNSQPYVSASASDLELSSTFSQLDALASTTITTFSLSAANLQSIPVAGEGLHLVLPTSIQTMCVLTFVYPTPLYPLQAFSPHFPQQIARELRAEEHLPGIGRRLSHLGTVAHKKQLATWLDAKVLLIDDATITADSSHQEERSGIVGTAKAAGDTSADVTTQAPSTDEGSSNTATLNRGDDNSDAVLMGVLSITVPAALAMAIVFAFVVRNRRRMRETKRHSDDILDLPPPFSKLARDRSEASTDVESELSRSGVSSRQHTETTGNNSHCIAIAITPTGESSSQDQEETSTPADAGYINLTSPESAMQTVTSSNSRANSGHCSNESASEVHRLPSRSSSTKLSTSRLTARQELRAALQTLLECNGNRSDGASTLLTVNNQQYSFSRSTTVEETPLAFFVACRRVRNNDDSENATAASPAPSRLVLKLFVEQDADLAGRESYALSCLHHDEATRVFAPRLFDEALEYELKLQATDGNGADTVNCSVLVMELPSCTTLQHVVRGQVDVSEEFSVIRQFARIVAAVRALHTRSLVHGALHMGSLVACPPDAQIKFWGLEHASRAGHTVPCPDVELLELWQAECIAPELAPLALEGKLSTRASPALDIWSLGVMLLKMYASRRELDEFQGCATPREVLERVSTSVVDGRSLNGCRFEKSITLYVPHEGVKDLLRQCLQREPSLRLSIDAVLQHKVFRAYERELIQRDVMTTSAVARQLSAIFEEEDASTAREPEREASSKEELPRKLQSQDVTVLVDAEEVKDNDDAALEPLPPTLWLFLPPPELELDLNQRASFYSVAQWVARLTHFQQQGEELRFPLLFLCENSSTGLQGSATSVSCSPSVSAKHDVSVPASLLSLVMPLVRETMLFLEARAILSNGLSVGEASGLAGPQQWEELRTFYRALESMELATVNPVNELMLAPLEELLRTREPTQAQQVLDELKCLVFSEEKRQHVRSLLDALASHEELETHLEERMQSGWASLRRCEVTRDSATSLSPTRWLYVDSGLTKGPIATFINLCNTIGYVIYPYQEPPTGALKHTICNNWFCKSALESISRAENLPDCILDLNKIQKTPVQHFKDVCSPS
ncbi:hypothetical protein BBJ28_00013046 [Nothophytophthora sp. Chile5]|nr:hypothetical protein BBJ28_00013046 [Nothophytophthora sp. Chile5]